MAAGATLVIDVGTSSLKAALLDGSCAIVALAERGYGPDPAPHRQDPDAWWQAAIEAVRALGPVAPAAITFAGTMENLIPVSAGGNAVGPAVLYSDPCGAPYCDASREALEAMGAAAILGNAPEPLMTAFKIQWLQQTDPGRLARARWLLLSPKDALILRMTGEAVTDPTTATTSGLMDLARRDWCGSILDGLGIAPERLPAIRDSGHAVGPLRAEAAQALGMETGIPVVTGCGDAGASTVGAGCRGVGDVSIYLGTSGWVARVVSDAGIGETRPCYRLAHPAPGQVIEIAPLLSAGGCTAWARQAVGLDLEAADRAALAADADPPGLLFLPYLGGERAPFVDLDVRAAFLGLDGSHGSGDLYYAVLEGVAFAIAANLRALTGERTVQSVRLSGGGARSAVWPGLIADILDVPVSVAPAPEFVTACGAAMLARAGPGADQTPARVVRPRADRRARAARRLALFEETTAFARTLGPRLRPA